MQIEQELTGADLVLTALTMLYGIEGMDWSYYEQDPDWWKLRLWIRRN